MAAAKEDKESLAQYCAKKTGIVITDCRWGSRVYAEAQALYDTLNNEKVRDEVIKKFNIVAQPGNPVDTRTVLTNITDALNSRYAEDQVQFQAGEFENLDAVFAALRGQSWDLWTAVKFMFQTVYPIAVLNVDKSGDHEIGLMAHLLTRAGLVSDESFRDFET